MPTNRHENTTSGTQGHVASTVGLGVVGVCGLLGCTDPSPHKHCPSMIQPWDPFNKKQQAGKTAQEYEAACIKAFAEGFNAGVRGERIVR